MSSNDRTNESPIEIARTHLLQPTGLDDGHLEQALNALLGGGVDSAELYFQVTRSESWSLEDGIVKEGSHSIDQGVGARAIAGEKTGFAYSDEIVLPALLQASTAASAIARSGKQVRVQAWQSKLVQSLYPPLDPLMTITDEQKVRLLEDVDRYTRSLDECVQQVMASLSASHEVILVCNTSGVLEADIRPLVRMNVSVIVERNGRREQGFAGGGGRDGYSRFLESDQPREFAAEAVRQAMVNLEAQPTPAGEMTVVLGPGWPGVLLHEAIGHGLEGDFNRKGTSAFSGKLGEIVASEFCTIVDDGTLPGRRGSLNIDDEGTVTQQTTLIENGRLCAYMQDQMNAKLMGM
jgi:TldD protein